MSNFSLLSTKPALTQEQQWSGKLPLPEIGDRVYATCNSFGPSTVTGYFTQGRWIGITVMPDKCPEFYLNQNRAAFQRPDMGRLLSFCFFGAEIGATDVPAPAFNAAHEVAVIVVKAKHGKNWEDVLGEVWCNGTYAKYDLNEVSGLLQTIRNSEGGREFAFGLVAA
jgi:hypothetical protein